MCVFFVFRFDVVQLEPSVWVDLADNFYVFLHNLLDFALFVVNQAVLDFNLLAIFLILFRHSCRMTLSQIVQSSLSVRSLNFFLGLQLLKPRRVFQHLLTVLISLRFNFCLVLIHQKRLLLLIQLCVIYLSEFAGLKLLLFCLPLFRNFSAVVCNFICQLFYF